MATVTLVSCHTTVIAETTNDHASVISIVVKPM